jgi:hypothetical protein
MMSQPSERIAVVATIDPATYNDTEQLSDAVDMSKWHELMAVVLVGDMPASSTLDITLKEASTSGGSYAAIAGKSATQLGASDDNKQVVINLKAEELGAGKQFVKLSCDPSAHNTIFGGVVLGVKPRYAPASDDDLSSVTQIVT